MDDIITSKCRYLDSLVTIGKTHYKFTCKIMTISISLWPTFSSTCSHSLGEAQTMLMFKSLKVRESFHRYKCCVCVFFKLPFIKVMIFGENV